MTQATINSKFLDTLSPDEMRKLAVFMKLKSLYSNSCVFNFSYRSLSAKSGISVNTLKKTIKFFLDKGWCYWHGKNIVFGKIKDVDNTKGKGTLVRFKILKKHSYRDVLKRLRLSFVKAAFDKFNYVKRLSRDYINPKRNEPYKKALKAMKNGKLHTLISASAEFSISNKKIGQMINRSKSTASLLIRYAKLNKLLSVKVNVSEVKLDPLSLSDEKFKGRGYFLCNGKVLRQRANNVKFSVSFS